MYEVEMLIIPIKILRYKKKNMKQSNHAICKLETSHTCLSRELHDVAGFPLRGMSSCLKQCI